MALGDLLAALARDADAEVHRTLASAEQDAAQIDADTARYCSARLAEAMRDLTANERTKHTARFVEME